MADAIIDMVGPEDLPVIVQLYNQIFRPPRDLESFRRRFRGRYNILHDGGPHRGTAGRLFPGLRAEADRVFRLVLRRGARLPPPGHRLAAHGGGPRLGPRRTNTSRIRFECHNQHRPMLHLAIALEYDIVGIRWDPDRGDNLVMFEKGLNG